MSTRWSSCLGHNLKNKDGATYNTSLCDLDEVYNQHGIYAVSIVSYEVLQGFLLQDLHLIKI